MKSMLSVFLSVSFLRSPQVVQILFHVSSRSFRVLAFVFKSTAHLELIVCVCGVRTGVGVLRFHVFEYPATPTAFVEKTFPIGLLWRLVQNSVDPVTSVGLE